MLTECGRVFEHMDISEDLPVTKGGRYAFLFLKPLTEQYYRLFARC